MADEGLEPFPWRLGRDLAAGMAELDGAERALVAQKVGDPAPRPRLRVGVDTGTAIGLAGTLVHRGLLDEDDAGAAHRELAEMNEVPIAGLAVDRQVLRHRRHDDAVARRHAA